MSYFISKIPTATIQHNAIQNINNWVIDDFSPATNGNGISSLIYVYRKPFKMMLKNSVWQQWCYTMCTNTFTHLKRFTCIIKILDKHTRTLTHYHTNAHAYTCKHKHKHKCMFVVSLMNVFFWALGRWNWNCEACMDEVCIPFVCEQRMLVGRCLSKS